MRLLLKIGLALLACFFVLILILASILNFSDWNNFRGQLSRLVAATTDFTITDFGKLEGSLGTSLTVTIQDLTVEGSPDMATSLFSVENVSLAIPFWESLRNGLTVDRLWIDGAQVVVRKTTAKQPDIGEGERQAGRQRQIRLPVVRDAVVQRVSASYVDPAKPRPLAARINRLRVAKAAKSQPLTFDGTITAADNEVTVKGDVTSTAEGLHYDAEIAAGGDKLASLLANLVCLHETSLRTDWRQS